MQTYEPGRRRSDPLGNGEILGKTTCLNPSGTNSGLDCCNSFGTMPFETKLHHYLFNHFILISEQGV